VQAIFMSFAKILQGLFYARKEKCMLNKKAIQKIEELIGYVFTNKQLISQAFTRSSYHYEHPEEQDNEVLEFIGDPVLSLIVVNELIEKYTGEDGRGLYSCRDEGDLSALKSALVNKQYLAKCMSKLCLQDYLRMSIGDEVQGVQNGKSVLEDLFESIVGAIYLDTGKDLKKTATVVIRLLDIDRFLKENNGKVRISFKNDLQEWCHHFGYDLPVYDSRQTENGYISYCEVEELGVSEKGEGHNRREAENNAAELVLQYLEEEIEPNINKYIVTRENAINMLQEHCQAEDLPRPEYETVKDEIYDDNSHSFTVQCHLCGCTTEGKGSKVKEAKKQAAYNMLDLLGLVD